MRRGAQITLVCHENRVRPCASSPSTRRSEDYHLRPAVFGRQTVREESIDFAPAEQLGRGLCGPATLRNDPNSTIVSTSSCNLPMAKPDGDIPNFFWLLTVDGSDPNVGASEAIIQEDNVKTTALVEWRYQDISASSPKQIDLKVRPL
jgi:hypothetical protein